MAGKRIIPCLPIKEGRAVVPDRFGGFRDLGHPAELACRFELEGADALMVTVTDGSAGDSWITEVAHALAIPLLVGGGIRSLEAAERWLLAGADAVLIEDAPDTLREASLAFGREAVMASLDLRAAPEGGWRTANEGPDLTAWMWQLVDQGAGSLHLRFPERAGSRTGFDVDLIAEAVRLPISVLAGGGAGSPEQVAEALECGLDGVVATTLFLQDGLALGRLKTILAERGLAVRR